MSDFAKWYYHARSGGLMLISNCTSKVAAKAAWDHQQDRIQELEMQILELQGGLVEAEDLALKVTRLFSRESRNNRS